MKRNIFFALIVALIAYSLTLLFIEFSNDQEAVRPYFTDIAGSVIFYAVNTSLSVFLLWSTALLFLITLTFTSTSADLKVRLFFLSQVCVFAYLGLDDRFLLHERIARRLDIYDHYVLLTVGIAEACFLWFLGRQYLFRLKHAVWLFAAVFFFGLMFFVDAFLAYDLPMRLSFEDLFKLWSGLAFLLFAYSILDDTVETKSRGNPSE